MTELEREIVERARGELVAAVRVRTAAATGRARKRTSRQQLYIDRLLTLAIERGGVADVTPRECAPEEFAQVEAQKQLQRAKELDKLHSNIRTALSRYRKHSAPVTVQHETGTYCVTFLLGEAAKDGVHRLELRVERISDGYGPEKNAVDLRVSVQGPEQVELRIHATTYHAPTYVRAYPLTPRADRQRISGCVWSVELPNGTVKRWRATHPALSEKCTIVGDYRVIAYVLLDGNDMPAYIARGAFSILSPTSDYTSPLR